MDEQCRGWGLYNGTGSMGDDYMNTDRLTGLPNISSFFAQFGARKEEMASAEEESVLVYFNVTNLKSINNRHGFAEGDNVLRATAEALRNVFSDDLISRLAEDHFAVLTYSKDDMGRGIQERAYLVQSILKSMNVNLPGIKAGVYRIPRRLSDIPSASECCDKAKLACDSIRKNYAVNYCEYDSQLKARQEIETFILENFEGALARHEIDAWYQPIIRTTNRQIADMEALCRWIDPVKGFISPAEFIPVLEEYLLIGILDLYILERVCATLDSRRKNGEPIVPISINFSRLDFELTEDLCTAICHVVEEYKLPRSLIHIEITESALSKNTQFMKLQIARLREAGFEMWMDDFGSGYSSLNTLAEFSFDTIKLDMMFMRNFNGGKKAQTILRDLISMLKDLKLQIVVEGVETKEQYHFLHRMGCDFVQGWLYSPAVSQKQIVSLTHIGPMDLTVQGFETETADRTYYNQIGLVNTLHPDLEGIGHNMLNLVSQLPMAIIEYKNNRMRYIRTSPSYRDFLHSIHIQDEAQSELLMNDMSRKLARGFHEGFRQTVESNDWASMDFMEQDMFCIGHARLIAKNERTGAASLFFICLNLSSFGYIDRAGGATRIEQPLLSLYSRIDLLSPNGGLFKNLFCDSQRYLGQMNLRATDTALKTYADLNVHENDKNAFLEYYDMTTVRERLAQNGGHHLAAIFNTRTMDGSYEPQLYLLINTRMGEEEMLLSCVRDVTIADRRSYQALNLYND